MGSSGNIWKNIEGAFRGTTLDPSRKIVENFKAANLNLKNLGMMSKTFAELHLRQSPPDRAKSGAYSAVGCLCYVECGEWSSVRDLVLFVDKEKLWEDGLIRSFKLELNRKESLASIELRPRSTGKPVQLPFSPSHEFSSSSRKFNSDIQDTIFLSSLTSEQLQRLLSEAKPKKFEKGSTIFGQGDYPETFYILIEGSVRLRSKSGFEKMLTTGDIFGEMAVLGHMQRTATAECQTDSLLLEFTKDSLYTLFERYPELEKQIQKTFEFRLFSLRARNIPSLEALDDKRLQEVFKLFQSTTLSVGEVLFRQGEPSDGIFCILSGLLQVNREKTPIATLGPGSFVGEVGAFRSIPRTADVVGATDALLLCCRGEQFSQLKTKFPGLRTYLEGLSATRSAKA